MRIKCPQCGRVLPDVPETYAPRPFCSPRCKLADLSNWLNEVYRIPLDDMGDEGGDPSC